MTVEYRSSTLTNMDVDEFSGYAPRNRSFKVATVCLGVLCVLLLAGVIGQTVHYLKVERDHQNILNALNTDKENLQENLKMIQKEKEDLEVDLDQLQQLKDVISQGRNQLKVKADSLTVERDQLERKFGSMTAEQNQLLERVHKLTAIIQGKKCPAGWKTFQCSCYFTSSTNKTWSQSRDYCQSKGADLAIISSKEEMNFINGLHNSEAWIGLTDGGEEGQWKWVDGTPLNQSFWAKDQPNSYLGRNQDCVEFWHRDAGFGDWNDENCDAEQPWICEI